MSRKIQLAVSGALVAAATAATLSMSVFGGASDARSEWVGAGPGWQGASPVIMRMAEGQTAFMMGVVDAFDDQHDRPHGRWEGINYNVELTGLLGHYDAGYAFQEKHGLSGGEIGDAISLADNALKATAMEMRQITAEFGGVVKIDLAVDGAVLQGLHAAARGQTGMDPATAQLLTSVVGKAVPGLEARLASLESSVEVVYSAHFGENAQLLGALLDENRHSDTLHAMWRQTALPSGTAIQQLPGADPIEVEPVESAPYVEDGPEP